MESGHAHPYQNYHDYSGISPNCPPILQNGFQQPLGIQKNGPSQVKKVETTNQVAKKNEGQRRIKPTNPPGSQMRLQNDQKRPPFQQTDDKVGKKDSKAIKKDSKGSFEDRFDAITKKMQQQKPKQKHKQTPKQNGKQKPETNGSSDYGFQNFLLSKRDQVKKEFPVLEDQELVAVLRDVWDHLSKDEQNEYMKRPETEKGRVKNLLSMK